MSSYTGRRSLDAEMEVDFEKGVVIMDYTLNKYQIGINSNTDYFDFSDDSESDIGEETGEKFTGKERFKRALLRTFSLPIGIGIFYFSHLLSYNSVFRDRFQHKYQHFYKYFTEVIAGKLEYTVEGQFNSKMLVYHLNSNLWFEYEMDGDYRNKLQKIRLKRRFVKITLDGKKYDTQDGWNLIFEFKGFPMYGSCTIRYI